MATREAWEPEESWPAPCDRCGERTLGRRVWMVGDWGRGAECHADVCQTCVRLHRRYWDSRWRRQLREREAIRSDPASRSLV